MSAPDLSNVTAIIFDTYGTVVDWRSSVIAEGRALAQRNGIEGIDWDAFTDAWKATYRPYIEQVRGGERPWATNDALQRQRLDEIVEEFGITGLSERDLEDFNRAWHRLKPWPDSLPGLRRIKAKVPIGSFSNGNFLLLANMANHSDIPWDFIISSDLFRHYKPDPEIYLGAINLLGGEAERLMLVAAHNYDLANARAHGMKTAFVLRPTMFGPNQDTNLQAEDDWDIITDSITGVADAMGV
ncbi:MAG: haloacid dehalogenase type II [Alphaproteobacteria bacterium]|jgi:2-haloacid dehalogenase|nr:haloacid dehalogenase type II [Alphaproteobacteria bacterium]MBT7943963.1 haloacid dehalogenase type II [Alphaproteobacteria bacterium]